MTLKKKGLVRELNSHNSFLSELNRKKKNIDTKEFIPASRPQKSFFLHLYLQKPFVLLLRSIRPYLNLC